MKTEEQLNIEANRIRERWINKDQDGATEPARPLNIHDIAHRAALDRSWAPSDADYTREQRGRLRRLREQIRFPDMCGFNGPEEEDFIEFPQLREMQRLANIKR
jgi:hypothetical protein